MDKKDSNCSCNEKVSAINWNNRYITGVVAGICLLYEHWWHDDGNAVNKNERLRIR